MHKIYLLNEGPQYNVNISSEIKYEDKQSKNGKPFTTASFSVACGNGAIKNQDGTFTQKEPTYLNVQASGDSNIKHLQHIGACKGTPINIIAPLETWSKKKEDGTYSSGVVVKVGADDMLFAYKPEKANKSQKQVVQVPLTPQNQGAQTYNQAYPQSYVQVAQSPLGQAIQGAPLVQPQATQPQMMQVQGVQNVPLAQPQSVQNTPLAQSQGVQTTPYSATPNNIGYTVQPQTNTQNQQNQYANVNPNYNASGYDGSGVVDISKDDLPFY